MRRAAALAFALLTIAATPAAAQDRSPGARQGLADLAFLLGQSHALRQACEGPEDQHWRSRMLGLLEVEAPEARLRTRLSRSFNDGFRAAQAAHPSCDAASKAEAARLAGRGRALAVSLATP